LLILPLIYSMAFKNTARKKISLDPDDEESAFYEKPALE